MVLISDVTKMFWGIIIDAGKRYSQVVKDGFHLSMAALEQSPGNDYVQVMLQHESSEFLLCTLQQNKLLQQPLDLVLSAGDEISFSLNGKGVVHLTGYLLNDEPEMDEFEDDEDSDAPELVDASDDSFIVGQKRKALAMLSKSKKLKMNEDDDEEDDEDEFSEDDLSFDEDEEEDDEDEEEEDEDDEEVPSKAKSPAQKVVTKDKTPSKSVPNTPKDGQPGKEKKKTPQAKEETPKTGKQKQNATTPASGKKESQKQQQTPPTTPKTPENGESSTKKKKKKNKKKKKDGDESMNDSTNSTPGSTPKSESKPKVEVTPKKKVVSGGTVVEDLKPGHGPEAKPGKMASVYYVGTLAKTNKRFDSCTAGKPFRFRLSQGEVIKGWDNGINGMKVGGKRKITVPANQAYGNVRQGPIPPNSSLVFEVELKAVS